MLVLPIKYSYVYVHGFKPWKDSLNWYWLLKQCQAETVLDFVLKMSWSRHFDQGNFYIISIIWDQVNTSFFSDSYFYRLVEIPFSKFSC